MIMFVQCGSRRWVYGRRRKGEKDEEVQAYINEQFDRKFSYIHLDQSELFEIETPEI